MTVAAKITFGTKVFMNAAPTAPTFALAELLDISVPKPSRDTIDATTHDSAGGAEEFIAEGTYDPGEMELTMNYIAGSATDTALSTALVGGALQNLKLQVKSATGTRDRTFQGFVTGYGPDNMPVKGKQTATATIKVTGAATEAATA